MTPLNHAYFSHLDDYLTDPPIAAYEVEAEYLWRFGLHAEAVAFERTARRIRWARQARVSRMLRKAAA